VAVGLNYRALGRWAAFWTSLAVGVVVAALVTIMNIATDRLGLSLLLMLTFILVSGVLARVLQGEECDRHVERGGALASGWRGAGVGIQCWPVLAALAWGVNTAFESNLLGHVGGLDWAPKVTFGPGEEVYYRGGAQEDEARRLGQQLQACEFFDGKGPKTVVLTYEGHRILVSVVVLPWARDDPRAIALLEEIGRGISGDVFDGRPVQMRLCNEYLRAFRTLGPIVGVPEGPWRKHYDAGDAAFETARYTDAEPHYRAALQEAERFGERDGRLVSTLNNLAMVCFYQGKTAEAEPLLRRALRLGSAALEPQAVQT
jgi:hypothetical protein